jgi:hypothetical protein
MEERLADMDNDDSYGEDDDSSIDDSERYDEFDIDGDGDDGLLKDGNSSGKGSGSAGSKENKPQAPDQIKIQ